jgi:hypothetical protein
MSDTAIQLQFFFWLFLYKGITTNVEYPNITANVEYPNSTSTWCCCDPKVIPAFTDPIINPTAAWFLHSVINKIKFDITC